MLSIENVRYTYPPTPLQEGLFFHAQSHKDATAYIGQLAYKIQGDLQVDLVQQCFDTLVKRHDMLRTLFQFKVFSNASGAADAPVERLRQVVLEEGRIDFAFEDLRSLTQQAMQDAHIDHYKKENVAKGFDLSKATLMRIRIFKTADQCFELVWSWHHIIMDGWTLGILQKEFIALYDAAINGEVIALPAPVPFLRYINWLQDHDEATARAFWANYLREYEGLARIPETWRPARGNEYQLCETTLSLGKDLSDQLYRLAKKYRVTLNHLLQTLWGILLAKYNGCRDVVFGTVVSGRSPEVEDVESIAGLFINTIPVRIRFDRNISFRELMQQVRDDMLDTEPYQAVQLAEIQSGFGSNQPLFNHLLVFESYPMPQTGNVTELNSRKSFLDLVISDIDFYDHNHYDFNLVIVPDGDIEVKCSFNAQVYDSDFIARLGKCYQYLALQVVTDEAIPADQLALLPLQAQRAQVEALALNGYQPAGILPVLLEESAARHAGREALFYEGKSWSYAALNGVCNRLAHHLRANCAVQAGDLVALLLDRSDQVVTGMLAILKAGGAYLPIDPGYPTERIQYILQDAAPRALITQSAYLDRLENFEGQLFIMDLELDGLSTPDNNPTPVNNATDAAYCLYTSGTTGTPKGSLIAHHSVINLVEGLDQLVNFEDQVRIAVIAPVVFDPFGKQLFLALLNGYSLYVVPDAVKKSPAAMWNYFAQHGIRATDGTPAWLQLMGNAFPEKPPAVTHWLIGGELLPAATALHLYEKYRDAGIGITLINEYGLTECCVDNCCYTVPFHTLRKEEAVPVGQPLRNNRVLVADETGCPVPEGVPGEIYLAGAALGLGYLNRPEGTHDRFVFHPLAPELRLFKTGDLGKWLPNGTLQCLGRKDRQIKLRGYRIELSEIEQLLRKGANVKEVFVTDLADPQGDRHLVAWYTTAGDSEFPEWKEHLRKFLPEYMIPAHCMHLPAFPVTANGKLDKRALPDPFKTTLARRTLVQPATETESWLLQTWQEILNRDAISTIDNFFELGGHSLKAIQIVFRIQRKYMIGMNLTSIFEHPTIKELAAEIEQLQALQKEEPLHAEEGRFNADEIIL